MRIEPRTGNQQSQVNITAHTRMIGPGPIHEHLCLCLKFALLFFHCIIYVQYMLYLCTIFSSPYIFMSKIWPSCVPYLHHQRTKLYNLSKMYLVSRFSYQQCPRLCNLSKICLTCVQYLQKTKVQNCRICF